MRLQFTEHYSVPIGIVKGIGKCNSSQVETESLKLSTVRQLSLVPSNDKDTDKERLAMAIRLVVLVAEMVGLPN